MRHLKTSLTDLRHLFNRGVTSRYLAEPLVSFDGTQSASDIRRFAESKSFDVVGVRQDGLTVGYVNSSDLLSGAIEQYLRVFAEQEIIDDHASITTVLVQLRERGESPLLFLRSMGHVTGIITKGDLQKMPVRTWLFSLVSLVEMHLLKLVRLTYPGQSSWIALLSSDRVLKA